MGKQLYKVELTGWIAKDDEDSDIMDWSIDAITNDMVGFEIETTLVDASEWTHVPITTTVTDGKVGINVPDLEPKIMEREHIATPTVHVATDITTNESGSAMDIELDTKGMSL